MVQPSQVIYPKDKDALDVIDALLPAGTLSGAPKIKASSLIYQLEKQKRYLYGGAIGYIDFTGQMDTCIAIRLLIRSTSIFSFLVVPALSLIVSQKMNIKNAAIKQPQ